MALGYTASCTSWLSTTGGRSRRRCSASTGAPNEEETRTICDAKSLIFEGFRKAVAEGAPQGRGGDPRGRAVRGRHSA